MIVDILAAIIAAYALLAAFALPAAAVYIYCRVLSPRQQAGRPSHREGPR